jgi:hypothetical protein
MPFAAITGQEIGPSRESTFGSGYPATYKILFIIVLPKSKLMSRITVSLQLTFTLHLVFEMQ